MRGVTAIKPLMLAGLCALVGLSWSPCFAANKEALSNERFPVNPKHTEEQWQIDCHLSLTTAKGALNKHSEIDIQRLQRQLQLCSFIYNTPNRDSFQECPNYRNWQLWLGNRESTRPQC